MGNRKTREYMLKSEDEELWRLARTEPRTADTDVHARGIGLRRVQLIVYPSFFRSRAWEMRQLEVRWTLYKSEGVEGSPLLLAGYDLVSVDSSILSSYFERLAGFTVPLAPYLCNYGVADGTGCQISLFGDLGTSWRFRWEFDSPPPQWQPLSDLAHEMDQVFSQASGAAPAHGLEPD